MNDMADLYGSGFKAIKKHIQELSLGNFTYRGKQANKFEEYKALKEGLNMLGEELEDITASKKHFEKIFNSLPGILILVNYDGTIIQRNEEAIKFFLEIGIEPSCLSEIAIHCDMDTTKINKQIADIDKKNKVVENILFFEKCDKYLKVRGQFYEKKEKNFLLVAIDITEAVTTKNKQLAGEKKFNEIFNQSSYGVFTMFSNGELVDVNDSFKKITNIDIRKKKSLFQYFTSVYETFETTQSIIKAGGVITNQEIILHKKNKVQKLCLLSLLPVPSSTNEILYYGIIRDISIHRNKQIDFGQTLNSSQENLRRQISFELHDGIGQQLSGIKFMLSSIAQTAENEKQKHDLEILEGYVLQALTELKGICFNLMPATLEKYGLINTLKELIKRLHNTYTSVKIQLETDEVAGLLRDELSLNIYRIIQELVNNAIKHSSCNKIIITIEIIKKAAIQIVIKDNGIGFEKQNLEQYDGLGLKSLLTRVNNFHGVLKLESDEIFKTFFIITFPI